MIMGVIGCFLPVLPGPPVSYAGLLFLQFSSKHPFSLRFLIIMAVLTALVSIIDYLIPVFGTRKFQGSKYGVIGSALGLIIGLFFFPPFGIIIGPILGAFIGELIRGRQTGKAMQSALGSFVGFLAGMVIKLLLTITMAYYFVISIL